MKILLSGLLVILLLVFGNVQAELSGCLTKGGVIKAVADGPDPLRPCKSKETQVSLGNGEVGPMGDKGDTGDTGPQGPSGNGPAPIQFVGLSQGAPFQGDGGVAAMNRACSSTHTGSHMCSSKEILESGNPAVRVTKIFDGFRPDFDHIT